MPTSMGLGLRRARSGASVLCLAVIVPAGLSLLLGVVDVAARPDTHHPAPAVVRASTCRVRLPSGQPSLAPGPTELVSGLYLAGGPPHSRSAPRCSSISGSSSPGTITVTNPATSAIVATKTAGAGRLARIPLPPGTYTIVGTFADAISNGRHMQSRPRAVTIPAGKTVRQNLFVSIP